MGGVIGEIVGKKFEHAIAVYYTSYWHHGFKGGIGSEPDMAEKNGLRECLGDEEYRKLLKKYPELEGIADKSNPENWRIILEVFPIVCANPNLTKKMEMFGYWPEEIRRRIICFTRINNPTLAENIERYWKMFGKR